MWISLTNLPLEFWFVEAIIGVASTLEEFICFDKNIRTRATLNNVIFCINIYVSKPMQTRICMTNKKGDHYQ